MTDAERNDHFRYWDRALQIAPDPLSLAVAALERQRYSLTSRLWWSTGRLRRRCSHFEIGVYTHTRRSPGCRLVVVDSRPERTP